MNAMKPINSKLRGIEYEAMAKAEMYGLDDHKPMYFELIRKRYLEDIEPYVQIKMNIFSLAMPNLIYKSGKFVEVTYQLSDSQKATLEEMDKEISAIAESYKDQPI